MTPRDLPPLDHSLERLNRALPAGVGRREVTPESVPLMVAHFEQWRTLLRGELVRAHGDREPRVGAEKLIASLAVYEEQSGELILRGPEFRERAVQKIAHELQVSPEDLRSVWRWWDNVLTVEFSALRD